MVAKLRFDRSESLQKEELRGLVYAMGADLVGLVTVADLDHAAPAEIRPSTLAEDMKTVVVLGKRILKGVAWSRHLPSKQLAGGRALRLLDRLSDRLVRLLEENGYPSLPLSSACLDFERTTPEDLAPAGQGSRLLRLAAVEAGLGTWGLNEMVLTFQFGPRVYFAAVMTRLAVDGDTKIKGELCLGLEKCGRCAAICPEDAIPRRAPIGAALESYRGLNCSACVRSSQPFGFQAFVNHLVSILETKDPQEMWNRMRGRKTGEMWTEMAMMKEASITGCSECLQVCPVGEDYGEVLSSPHRCRDLPEELPRVWENGYVQIENLGPQVRRKMKWDFEDKPAC